MATNVGKLNVLISASAKGFTKGVNDAQRKLGKFTSGVASSAAAMGPWAIALAAASAGVIALNKGLDEVIRNLGEVDKLAKTAEKLGFEVEELQKFRFAAEKSGVEVRTLDMAMQRFTRRMAEAANDMGEARGALLELGLDARRLQALSAEDQMIALADAFAKIENQSDRLRLAFKLFDSEGAALVTMFKDGSGALEEYFGQAEKLGLLTEEDAKKAAEYADATTELKHAFSAMSMELSVSLAPALISVTESMVDFFVQARQNGTIDVLSESLSDMATTLGDLTTAFGPAIKEAAELSRVAAELFRIIYAPGRIPDFADVGKIGDKLKVKGSPLGDPEEIAKVGEKLGEGFLDEIKGFSEEIQMRADQRMRRSDAPTVEIDKKQVEQIANPQALVRGSAAAISKSLELRQRREQKDVADEVRQQKEEQVARLDNIVENTADIAQPKIVSIA